MSHPDSTILQPAALQPSAAEGGTRELLEQLLAEVRGLRADLTERSASVSSVELSENAKGAVQLTVKRYADSQPQVDEALEDFAFGMRELQRLQMANWAETMAPAGALGGKPGAGS